LISNIRKKKDAPYSEYAKLYPSNKTRIVSLLKKYNAKEEDIYPFFAFYESKEASSEEKEREEVNVLLRRELVTLIDSVPTNVGTNVIRTTFTAIRKLLFPSHAIDPCQASAEDALTKLYHFLTSEYFRNDSEMIAIDLRPVLLLSVRFQS